MDPEQTNMLIMVFVPTSLLMKILPTSLYYCYYRIQLCNSIFCCKPWPVEDSHHWASQWYLMILFSSTFPITVVQWMPCGLSCWITQLLYLPTLNIYPLEYARSPSLWFFLWVPSLILALTSYGISISLLKDSLRVILPRWQHLLKSLPGIKSGVTGKCSHINKLHYPVLCSLLVNLASSESRPICFLLAPAATCWLYPVAPSGYNPFLP